MKRSKKAKFVGKPGHQLSLEVTGLEEMFVSTLEDLELSVAVC